MAYPHKWSPISYKSCAGQRKHIGQRPMLYRWTTQPTIPLEFRLDLWLLETRITGLSCDVVYVMTYSAALVEHQLEWDGRPQGHSIPS